MRAIVFDGPGRSLRAAELLAGLDVRGVPSTYRLEQANQALEDLRGGRFAGAAVIVP